MKKRVLFLVVLFSLLLNQSQAQIKWQLKDSVIKFPSNFNSWIERNVGKYNPYSDPLGTRIPSFQLKETGDFNKDGYTDLCMELNLRFFDTNNPSNPTKYQDSLMNYYKGIFINQKNGTYLLDTNYIIHGRGAIWDGGFGDFNGDGLIDYYNNCVYYEFDPQNKDLSFYKYSNKTYSPSHVYFNNGKSFDRIDLDTVDMNTTNCDIVDINKDGKDEIVVTAASKFILYQYDTQTKTFNKKFNNVNDYINKKYGTTIKFFNFKEKIDNSILLTLSHSFTQKKEDWMVDILQINLTDSSIKIKNSFKHPSYKLTDGSLAMAGIADKKGNFKYEDLNKDGVDELIWLGYFSFNNSIPSIFQSNERMGINVIENNQPNTPKYWNYDTTEIGFRVGGYITDLNGDKTSEIISEEWLDNYNKYFAYYYSLESGMYNKKYIEPINKNVVIKKSFQKKFHTWADDFDKNGTADIIIYDPDNLTNNYIYKSIDCKDIFSKPLFNTSNFSICGSDSLKLTISNVNKGDTLKWFYGTKSDITNVTSKTFNDVTSLFVTRTDSIGCVSSSDTIQIKKFSLPSAPTISRDTANNLVSSAAVRNTWYKDGAAISDTAQKIKPSGAGSFTVKTSENGCASVASNAYYYLVTDIINLSADEFIKLAPNPFQGLLNFDFSVKGYQKLNVEVFDLTSGTKRATQQNVLPGSVLSFGNLTPGSYIIKVSSNDQKLSHQFKMIKL